MSTNESFGDLTTFYVHTGAVGVHVSLCVLLMVWRVGNIT